MDSTTFEMVRVTKSKKECDLAPNTVRKIAREGGLNIYKVGKAAWFSRVELSSYIRSKPAAPFAGARSRPQ